MGYRVHGLEQAGTKGGQGLGLLAWPPVGPVPWTVTRGPGTLRGSGSPYRDREVWVWDPEWAEKCHKQA